MLAAIAEGRRASVAEVQAWVDAAPFTPEQGRARGLVDAIAYADEIQGDLEAWLGRPVVIRAVDKRRLHGGELGRGLEIAVVHIEGILRGGSSFRVPLVGQRIAGSKTLTEAIDRAAKDPHIGALVVRIDSVGGSVAAAAAITRSLSRAAEEKPVIISFGNVAASGGYYLATAGSVIFSDALTATGSIGIFLAKVDLSGLFARLGIGIDRLSFGAAAAMGSWTKPYSDHEREVARAGIERSYEIFIDRVAEARGLDRAAVDALARGRVWRGLRAVQIGLADHDGGLHDAISHARGLLGRRGGRARVVHLPASSGIRAQLSALGGLRLPFSATLGAVDTDAAEATGGTELALLGPLLPILRRLPLNLWLLPSADELAMAPEFVFESI
ncbi:MAG TPA: signal peptide peptidase SppA [Nannocystis exedens]|nr:signal peptide peptidase SppA [Nannocystis exedens]